ncbi:MAG: hypothetical protein E6G40_07100 [Actinobacteria bacterium]|nr:MAG: hypothetical protein E6G40_07100 [Actinomycetota bacterium]
MRLLRKRKLEYFDVPVQDMLLRVTGPEDFYEEVRAAGMLFWEQIQSYGIRNPAFRTSKRPLEVPETAPAIVREMAQSAAAAGVGPMFTFQGALTEYVGRKLRDALNEITVSCGEDHFVVSRRRMRLAVHPGLGLAVVVKPELGPNGIYMKLTPGEQPREVLAGLVVVGETCIVADAAAAATTAIVSKANGFRTALTFLKGLPRLHGALLIQGHQIGVTGALELAA